MKVKTFSIYVTYVWTKVLLGLTYNPYKYVKETINRPVLLPVILSPILGILILLIAGKIASLQIIIYGLKRELIAIILSTTLISIILWQILILYLLISFIIARKKSG